MKRYKQGILCAVFVLAVFLVSVPAHAAQLTTDQVQAILGMLRVFGADQSVIGNVQVTLTGGASSSTPTQTGPGQQGSIPRGQVGKLMCVLLNRNLAIGTQGDDVRKLQDILREDPETGFTASSTGLFGPQTAKAMARFQIKNGIASSTTGEVGPRTRAFFERSCGKGLENSKKEHEDDREDRQAEHATSTKATEDRRMYFGSIQSIANSSLTLQLKNGSTTPVISIVPATVIKIATASSTSHAGTIADLTVGTQVGVEVSKSSTGSLTALMVGVGMLTPQTQAQPKKSLPPPQMVPKKTNR